MAICSLKAQRLASTEAGEPAENRALKYARLLIILVVIAIIIRYF
jgi:hypothetical protein